mmetsp:Transcript_10030/g.13413  ORF Transcript_10030/g.13413 Transcript_10030/m.13413 type:complete len:83 (-) Transcript_10030:309-557(-)
MINVPFSIIKYGFSLVFVVSQRLDINLLSQGTFPPNDKKMSSSKLMVSIRFTTLLTVCEKSTTLLYHIVGAQQLMQVRPPDI